MTVVNLNLTPAQYRIFESRSDQWAYGGAAGGGKSNLHRKLAVFLCILIPRFQAFLFRRTYRDLMLTHCEGPESLAVILEPLVKKKLVRITKEGAKFHHGSRIHLCHCQHEDDVYRYKSTEMHYCGIDESGDFTEMMLRFLWTRCRIAGLSLPEKWANRLPMMGLTFNPGGEAHEYIKAGWYDPHPGGGVAFRAPESDGGALREFFPARLYDNPHIDHAKYAANLKGLGSEELVRMYLEGDMNVVLGSYFRSFGQRHICRPFTIPSWWYRFRSLDWGMEHNHACYWYAVSDGSIETIPEGCLVIYREQVANRVIARDLGELICRRTGPDENIRYTVIDPAALNKKSDIAPDKTIGSELAAGGLQCVAADNERIRGWQQLQYRIEHGMILVFDDCKEFIKVVTKAKNADLDREDVKKFDGDDPLDSVRYGCMSHPIIKRKAVEPAPIKSFKDYSYNDLHKVVEADHER